MATHYTYGVTHFFILLLFQPEQPLVLLQAWELRSSSVPLLFSEKAGLSFAFLPKSASGQPLHTLPNHWQNGAATLHLAL